ncbi:hypothetical protein LOK49_LG06G03185 [Camellia lanceoleosa]|uniref:Uncharacterized protein n=1 Tax=Camellia lanceoleosa TaxID=1840588 RepID=A0ACC0HL27_9ERIC|nr:hypothetical protein LOK49_LG06G03185 [Camellia lanceoleosa]
MRLILLQSAIDFLLDDIKRSIGAVNCIVRKSDGKFFGCSTDYVGAITAIEDALGGSQHVSGTVVSPLAGKLLVIGADGAGKALAYEEFVFGPSNEGGFWCTVMGQYILVFMWIVLRLVNWLCCSILLWFDKVVNERFSGVWIDDGLQQRRSCQGQTDYGEYDATKDFVEARKFVLKPQRLYPDLENISQMIMVCDVHCSAENKVFGNEKDWYGILKIDPTADEASIKKQYRSLLFCFILIRTSFLVQQMPLS